MAELYDVGDVAVLTLDVSPADEDTEATVVVTPPPGAGAPSSPTPTSNLDRSSWQLVLPLTAAGEWRAQWTVTGTGAGTQLDTVYAVGDPTGRAYATPSDYVKQLRKVPPDGIRLLLVIASRLVDDMARCAVYRVDEDGLPTSPAVAAALREATCAQADWLDETGDLTGSSTLYQSVSIGSVSLTRGYTSGGSAPGADQRYAPDARAALARAGLLGTRPLIPGRGGYGVVLRTDEAEQ